jgi:hypothetical protein
MKIHPEKPIDERHLTDEYRRLWGELDRLKEENQQLKARLQLLDTKDSNYPIPESNTEKSALEAEVTECFSNSVLCNTSDSTEQQYAGRLHRLYENKKEVRIYDYVDIQVSMLEKMYQRRLSGYAV